MAKKHRVEASSGAATVSEAPAEESKVHRREVTKSPDFLSIYTNDIQIQTSPWDLRISMGIIADISGDPPIVNVKHLADVNMSPQLAKKVAKILTDQLDIYEEQFGEIPGQK